jgi:hypothetical protein
MTHEEHRALNKAGPYLFPREYFPMKIEALHPQTRRVVWSQEVREPIGSLKEIYIPPLAKQLGHRVAMRITFATGEVTEEN